MSDDIGSAETLVRVDVEHAANQILEILREKVLGPLLMDGVSLPEEVRSIADEVFVVLVLLSGHAERRTSCVEDEKNHTKGEKIYNLALVWLAGEYLWSHVAWGTDQGPVMSGAITSLKRASEAEIGNLYFIIIVEKDVFRF